MHYLGLVEKIEITGLTQEKRAELISYIINRGDKNTKTFIANITQVMDNEDIDIAKTPKNLSFVLKLFEDLGLLDLANTVKKDMERISKSK